MLTCCSYEVNESRGFFELRDKPKAPLFSRGRGTNVMPLSIDRRSSSSSIVRYPASKKVLDKCSRNQQAHGAKYRLNYHRDGEIDYFTQKSDFVCTGPARPTQAASPATGLSSCERLSVPALRLL